MNGSSGFQKGIVTKAREGWDLPLGDQHNFLRSVSGMEQWLAASSQASGSVRLATIKGDRTLVDHAVRRGSQQRSSPAGWSRRGLIPRRTSPDDFGAGGICAAAIVRRHIRLRQGRYLCGTHDRGDTRSREQHCPNRSADQQRASLSGAEYAAEFRQNGLCKTRQAFQDEIRPAVTTLGSSSRNP